jgi:uncharacterized membrane protein (GlpM family)
MYFFLKILITSIIVVLISEISRRSTVFAGILASIPLTSLLALSWIYIERQDVEEIALLSRNIMLMIPPSLAFFVVFPYCLKLNIGFIPSLFIAVLITAMVYSLYIYLLGLFEIRLK